MTILPRGRCFPVRRLAGPAAALLRRRLVAAMAGLAFGASVFAGATTHPAAFIWHDVSGSGRQELVLFRRSLTVERLPERAELHLFADSHYQLHVNGTNLAFGPARFYPAHPEFDSFDLRPHLRAGENVIAVEVLSNGTDTYQVPLSRGGFIAWGTVEAGSQVIDLATPGGWMMFAPGSFDPQTVRFSFAKGPIEVRDTRREPAGWMLPGFDDASWRAPVALARQDYWGPLTPRSIPALTHDPIQAWRITGWHRQSEAETLLRFSVKAPDETRELYANADRYPLVAETWIWSPRDQEVTLGGWWGWYRIGGAAPIREEDDPLQYSRRNLTFRFAAGWNRFFFRQDTVWGGFDFYLAAPAAAELDFSPRQKRGDPAFMRALVPRTAEERALLRERVAQARSPEDVPPECATLWQDQERAAPARNPARELAWIRPDFAAPLAPAGEIRLPLRLHGVSILTADMGGMTLGSIFADLEAPAGTEVDVGWSEDLNAAGLPTLYKRDSVSAGARFTTQAGARRYATFKPYGARHLILRFHVPEGSTATLRGLGQVEQVYPFEKRGSFRCSNPMFDRIWEMGWRTLRVCAEDSYTDTPFRERGLYAGDMLPEYAITLVTAGDSRLARRSLLLFQDMYEKDLLEGAETHLNDYVLKTLLALEWYEQVSGDRELAPRVFPHYRRYFEHLETRRQPGGYYRAGKTFIEWTQIDKRADLTAYQTLVHASLRVMERLAARAGEDALAGTYRSRAEALGAVIRKDFWDEPHGAFHDGFRDGRPIDHRFAISSSYPILFGVADARQAERATGYILRDLQDIGTVSRNRRIHPYGAFFMLSAIYARGEAAFAEEFMLKHWSPMIIDGDDTAWENFDPGGRPPRGIGTRSHAWTGHPTWFLSTEVLGVKLGFSAAFEPGVIRIEPQSATLEWARGTVPHPAGLVTVDWRVRGDRLEMSVAAPAGCEVRVRPRGRLADLRLDLRLIP